MTNVCPLCLQPLHSVRQAEIERLGILYEQWKMAAENLQAEVDRLRAENEEMRRTFGSHPLFAEQRRKTIEECAKAAESCVIASADDVWAIAAAIRAMAIAVANGAEPSPR